MRLLGDCYFDYSFRSWSLRGRVGNPHEIFMKALLLAWRLMRRYYIYKGIVAIRALVVKRGDLN